MDIKQSAALPYRVSGNASFELLLVTTKRSGRWVIPKGNIHRRLTPWESAENEAWEEAGVRGLIERQALGTYNYAKRIGLIGHPSVVEVFPLHVHFQCAEWPEMTVRDRCWMSPDDAMAKISEPDLRALIIKFLARTQV
jgi:8-oxo-dGTP pyrophosphatase MutT (NUDIX family)